MKTITRFALLITTTLIFAGGASAAPVVCGNVGFGTRTVTITPGLAGGFCFGQNGNLQNADIAVISTNLFGGNLAIVDKDEVPGDPADAPLTYALTNGPTNTSGTWSFADSLWDSYARLFLGFHFGGGGNNADDNPDSFIVELAFDDASGTFALGGGQLNGLSGIFLLGVRCTDVENCHPDTRCPDCLAVPEPNGLALAAVGLGAMGFALRRRKASLRA